MKKNLKVISVGWHESLIEKILTPVEKKLGVDFIHYSYSDQLNKFTKDEYFRNKIVLVPGEKLINKSEIDWELLSALEDGDQITLNRVILSDRVACHLEYREVLRYATVLAKDMLQLFKDVGPVYIIGSWDSMIQGVAMMVARKLGIPFYVTKFSVIPHSYTTICEYPFPNHEVSISDKSSEELFLLATDVFEKWNAKNLVAPAYVSALTFIDIIKRLPFHIIELIRSIKKVVSGNKNKFVHHSIIFLIKQYLRKKLNLIFRKNNLLISDLPQQPFFFYGFHMQPESTIDVWAPFYSNQFEVVKAIARSMPVSHVLCVKIHVSDADNYSNSEIKKLKSIPGVLVVNPKVSSRKFIENASLIFSIQGTIGLEGCLLGQQVIMFGDSPVNRFSTATKVLDIDDLPNLINSKLFRSKPQVAQIVDDFAKFLTNYVPASYDDWATVLKKDLTIQEIENYVELYRKLFEINSVNIN